MELRPGIALTPTLQLVEPLAQGAMGSLWVATLRGSAQPVAIKFISTKLAHRQVEALARFKREAAAAARLTSPHVVETLAYGATDDGMPYIVMELLHGETLGQRLARDGRLEPIEAVHIVAQVALALEQAHGLGIVHRDIKPDNVFLCSGGGTEPFVKVLDFGTVKDTRTRSDSVVTATGVMVGTPEYMSPEQVLGSRTIDHRTDLWSLGVVAYQAITGREPFGGPHAQALCLAICMGNYEPATRLRDDLPVEIDAWFAQALARAPKDRFASARQMALGLAAIVGLEGGLELPAEASVPRGQHEEPEARPHDPMPAFDDLDEPTHVAGGALDRDDAVAEEPTPSHGPAPAPPRDRSDDEPTRAFHRDVLRAASGADRASGPPPAAAAPRERPARWRAGLIVLGTAGALGALAYQAGLLPPSRPASRSSAAPSPEPTPSAPSVQPARAAGTAGAGGTPRDAEPSGGSSPVLLLDEPAVRDEAGAHVPPTELDFDEPLADGDAGASSPAPGAVLDLDE